MTNKALTHNGTSHLKPQFNGEASDVCEVEIKFLVPKRPDNTPDKSIFSLIQNNFRSLGWIKTTERKTLYTRQLDTHDMGLLALGTTVRVRAESKSHDLSDISTPDVCIKFGKSEDDNGALRRSEFEARIADFHRVDLHPLFKKYPKDEFPELHTALEGVKEKDLREFFRIECIRTRHLVDFPEDVHGIKGKRFVGELLLDDVVFVLDAPGLPYPIIFNHDLEVEMEALFKPCDYDTHPDAGKYISSPMTAAESGLAMANASAHIQKASGNVLTANNMSKAERGFITLPHALECLQDSVLRNPATPKKRHITSAFVATDKAANDSKPHHNLDTDFGYVVRERNGTDPTPKVA
ncbi:MAG: hypothetical protein JWO78_1868 [Micavibrio sp.]|nr:hypothetical protein [Micavibrio sp.]